MILSGKKSQRITVARRPGWEQLEAELMLASGIPKGSTTDMAADTPRNTAVRVACPPPTLPPPHPTSLPLAGLAVARLACARSILRRGVCR